MRLQLQQFGPVDDIVLVAVQHQPRQCAVFRAEHVAEDDVRRAAISAEQRKVFAIGFN